MAGALTKLDIAKAIRSSVGLSRAASTKLALRIIEGMTDALAAGEEVKIMDFGTFRVLDKRERVGRNPKTGVEAPIARHRALTFRASKKLRDRVADGR
jgi:integration host factor subunit alpha